MANASRGGSSPILDATATSVGSGPSGSGPAARKVIPMGPDRPRIPERRSAANVAWSWIRQIKPTACGDPSPGGRGSPHAHLGWTCGCGSRASWLACGRWVGTCVSRRSSRPDEPAARGWTAFRSARAGPTRAGERPGAGAVQGCPGRTHRSRWRGAVSLDDVPSDRQPGDARPTCREVCRRRDHGLEVVWPIARGPSHDALRSRSGAVLRCLILPQEPGPRRVRPCPAGHEQTDRPAGSARDQ